MARARSWGDVLTEAYSRHREEVARGWHDQQCEWGPRRSNGQDTMYHICHCSKRRREADGYTEPPGKLIVENPVCPRCFDYVEWDGDCFFCRACVVAWVDGEKKPAAFTDDYGDLGEAA